MALRTDFANNPQTLRISSVSLRLCGERGLFAGAGGHLLDHGEHQLAVAIVEVGRVAADLSQEANFVFRKLRDGLAAAVFGSAFRKKASQGHFHRSGDFGKSIERGNSVTVLYPR